MQASATTASAETRTQSHSNLVPFSLLAAGFLARWLLAGWGFLNPDEAAHYWLSVQPSFALAYNASLTTAHPPLLILLLHYWQFLGNSEMILRLPSVLAGTAFSWVMFRWLEQVTDRATALIAFTLLLFSPSLITLSAEIRQYSLLLFFGATSLYFLERAIGERSPAMMMLCTLALYLAILSHYSALLFALTLGTYALIRLSSAPGRIGVIAVWVIGQLGGLALAAFLFTSHVSQLETRNLPQQIADTWLRSSIFHHGEDNLLAFVGKANIRVFHYLFGNNIIGVFGLILFLVGVVLLLGDDNAPSDPARPTPRQLGLLIILPFILNCGVALAGLYPYGGTRHNALLAAFAMPGVSVGLNYWRTRNRWWKPVVLAAAMAVCNFFPSPTGAYIQPKNQSRRLMTDAMNFLRQSVPPGSVIFTDYESGLLLSYYACHSKVVQFDPPFQPFLNSDCVGRQVISTFPRLWVFQADNFSSALRDMRQTYGLGPDATVWVFQAGWLVNAEPELRAQLRRKFGCQSPQNFGENIFLCQVTANSSQELSSGAARPN
jgi:4-amino-4-deoxy-L-arabinose transferase-like glycosyltransferase